MSAEEQSDDARQCPPMRSFGPDDLDPADWFAAAQPKRQFEMVLEPRHLAIALFLLVAQMGLVAGIAYSAGRSAAAAAPRPIPAAQAAATPPKPAPPLLTHKQPPVPQKAPDAQPAPVPQNTDGTVGPPAGVYLQVGSLESAAAQKTVVKLTQKGYQARLAPGADKNVVRVLVGPVPDGQVGDLAASLREDGYFPFRKRY